jgi:RNA polymerase sigma-70 factor (ECF subfamily)
VQIRMLLLSTAKLGPVNTEPRPQEAPLPATLEAFLRNIEARAFRFAELGLRHREDALDAVQDAMLKMLAYRDHPASEWGPLFWSILRNKMTDTQRRGLFRLRWLLPGSTDKDGETVDWADDAPGPSRQHDSREAWQHIHAALRALPARQREAFTLRVLEELDVADTARIMGCSEGSVKTHLSRARESLQKQLEAFR